MTTKKSVVAKHFVTFYSPGSFMAETTEKAIDAWDIDTAVKMAHGISERYSATPYAFRFSTRERGADDLDSHIAKTSPTYYLGGVVRTRAEIAAAADPTERTLLENMRCNHWERVVTNYNSYRWTQPLEPGDVVLQFTPRPKGKAKS